jgi:threonine/homoserine/homoserine lactone efflux protein
MSSVAVLGFLGAIVFLVITPGASLTLMVQKTLAGQRNAAGWVIAGTAVGIYLHASLAAAGLSAIVMQSSEAFAAVKIAGGVYLTGLGVSTIWQTRRQPLAPTARRLPWTVRHTFSQALLSNVLNPKAASIYLTLAPQFLAAEEAHIGSMLILASVHVLAMATWLTLGWSVLSRGHRVSRSEHFKRTANRAGGVILVALGVRTVAA